MAMAILVQCLSNSPLYNYYNLRSPIAFHLPPHASFSASASNSASASPAPLMPTTPITRRRALSLSLFTTTAFISALTSNNNTCWSKPAPVSDFFELPNSGGVRALDLRIPDDNAADTDAPSDGDKVVIHYYGRLAAKQGWRFDSTYDHKDENGEPLPFEFVIGSGKVIAGIESAVRTMKVGGIRRVIIPPSQGYQNTFQEPIPPNYFDRQRLFTTIFNPTRLANGEGATLGTVIFDIELVSLRRHNKDQSTNDTYKSKNSLCSE